MSDERSSLWLNACAERERYGAPEPVNVFYLDHDPELAAQYHCDAHLGAGVVAAAQLLSTAWALVCPDAVTWDYTTVASDLAWQKKSLPEDTPGTTRQLGDLRIYHAVHVDHPCAQWARACTGNYDWLRELGLRLTAEYTHRYGRAHPALCVLWALEAPPPGIALGAQTQPPPAMPEEFKVEADDAYDSVSSYRAYYAGPKQPLLKWTGRKAPPWLRRVGDRWVLAAV